MQLTHYTSRFKEQQFPIIVVCDNVTNAPNIGSLFRICDAFGVEKLILCGNNIDLGRKMQRTSRSTEKYVSYEINKSVDEIVSNLKAKGNLIISLEITSTSKPIHNFKFNSKIPIVLVIGDENFGISKSVLDISDEIIHIEMFGNNSSMNVVQAFNIALYEITKQLM